MSIDSSIVVDLGNSTVKGGFVFGFPSDDEPRVVNPAEVRVLPEGARAHTATPSNASGQPLLPPGGRIIHPVQQGIVQDWDALETLLHYVIYDELGWVEGEEGNLLLGDPILTSRPARERMATLVFETFNVAGYYVSDQAVLSLYAIGKLNGSVVDIGAQTIDVASVMEGLVIPSTSRRLPYGSHNLNSLLAKMLAARGVVLAQDIAAAEAAVETIKIKCMRAAGAEAGGAAAGGGPAGGEEAQAAPEEPATHTLPDGQTITIEREEGERLTDALLIPSLLGLELPPLAEVVVTAGVSHSEKDTRKALMENIFVCGGGAGAPAVPRRLLAEARAVAPPPLLPALCGVPEYMPEHTAKVAAWMGGALLAKVVFVQGQQVTKADYDEHGPLVVHRKCS